MPSASFAMRPLDAYRSSLGRCRPLDPGAERELARRYRAGDKRAGEQLVEASLPFVMTIAREYRRWGVPIEDIVQQGNLGLLRAAERFDPARECRLVTYAAYWIRAEIREYVVRGYRMVRLGTTKGERKALRHYRKTRESDPAVLASLAGIAPERAAQLVSVLSARDVSLDQPPPSGVLPIDRLAATDPTPEDSALAEDMRERTRSAVEAVLAEISPRERLIARSRWMRDDPLTLEQLGAELGVSKERVRQLEERIVHKLRARLEEFRDYAQAG